MQIKVPFPHMALNATDAPLGAALPRLWNTYFVPDGHSPDHILGWTAVVAQGAPGGKLATLVITCHGYVNKDDSGGFGLDLGTGIYRADTPRFGKLKGLVDNIWIFACQTARITNPTPAGSKLDGDGNLFCCEIAKAAGAYVTASTNNQYPARQSGIAGGLRDGYVPNWSGLVLTYGPEGNVVSHKKSWW
jgi:hypothetical protein